MNESPTRTFSAEGFLYETEWRVALDSSSKVQWDRNVSPIQSNAHGQAKNLVFIENAGDLCNNVLQEEVKWFDVLWVDMNWRRVKSAWTSAYRVGGVISCSPIRKTC